MDARPQGRPARAVTVTKARAVAALTALAFAYLALAGCTRSAASGWNVSAAQHYLDRRAQQWLAWPTAARDQGTVCISCHTALPYLLASDALEARRPSAGPSAVPGLRPEADRQPSAAMPLPQQRLLASVLERVRLWTTLPPYYPEQAANSRGTEAVLNALILVDRDAPSGQLSRPAQEALAQMWATQLTSGPAAGSWPWIQAQREPWEARDSNYFGAALAALAVERTPADYRARPDIQPGLARLRSYLMTAYAAEPLLNRIDLLWASARWPELMAPAARAALLAQIWAHQHADGGWNLPSLLPAWHRRDDTPEASGSDGYATGLITLALQLCGERVCGVPRGDPRLQHGLAWLRSHQRRWSGGWTTASLNHHFRPIHLHHDIARQFMDDAAAAYAVLALTQAGTETAIGGAPPVTAPVPTRVTAAR